MRESAPRRSKRSKRPTPAVSDVAPAPEPEPGSEPNGGDAGEEPRVAGAEAASSESATDAAADGSEVAVAGGEGEDHATDEAVSQTGEHPTPAQDEHDSGALERERLKSVLESLVFVSDHTVTALQLARVLKVKVALIRTLLAELITDYEGRGIDLIEVAGGFQFRSAARNADYVRDFVAQRPVRLTRAQLETLALIAYRQPITRPEIDEVRGVDSGSAVRVLLERALLKMLGRKDEPGRPLLYGTTQHFLEFFGMRSLKDLPTLREFTELNDENRALFKRKTGEEVEEAEAALLAAEEAARAEGESDAHISDEDLAELAAEGERHEAEHGRTQAPPATDGDEARAQAHGPERRDSETFEDEDAAEDPPAL